MPVNLKNPHFVETVDFLLILVFIAADFNACSC
jgi:hypothetical protein